MNTEALAVPVFAVEQAVKALKAMPSPTRESILAEQVLEQILAEGPPKMPQAVYAALNYDPINGTR